MMHSVNVVPVGVPANIKVKHLKPGDYFCCRNTFALFVEVRDSLFFEPEFIINPIGTDKLLFIDPETVVQVYLELDINIKRR